MQVIDSLSVPLRDSDAPKKILVGGLLNSLVVVLGIGSILTFGYSLRVTRDAAEGVNKLPEWDNWGDLLWSGFMLFVVSVVAFLIPISMLGFGFGAMIVGLVSGSSNESLAQFLAGAGTGLVVGGLGFLLLLFIGFFFPMMALRVAIHRSLGAAFDFGALLRDISRIGAEYVVMVAVLWVLSGAATTAAGFIAWIPVLPAILLAAFYFYLMLVASHTLGALYKKRLAQ
jgi:hypothetical protein